MGCNQNISHRIYRLKILFMPLEWAM